MPRTLLMELRNVESAMSEDREVTCPAGEKVETPEGPTCRCRLESTPGFPSLISVARDLSSWSVFCTGRNDIDPGCGYPACPTWRAARESEWRSENSEALVAPSGLRRTFSVEDLEEIERRREAGDTKGADAVQERIGEMQRLRDVGR